ncbi:MULTISPECIES: hypothetical protein [unclassified Streptomyces]|uniref:hypothetical protein n=1 Tax=unclassified Streptomyces TaxID=2593676 RepID=UPI0013A69D7A|nr:MULTISPECIES: hypothetical protein [unclassified Streptomyces]
MDHEHDDTVLTGTSLQRHAAKKKLASHATDPGELALFLDMLDLHDCDMPRSSGADGNLQSFNVIL